MSYLPEALLPQLRWLCCKEVLPRGWEIMCMPAAWRREKIVKGVRETNWLT